MSIYMTNKIVWCQNHLMLLVAFNMKQKAYEIYLHLCIQCIYVHMNALLRKHSSKVLFDTKKTRVSEHLYCWNSTMMLLFQVVRGNSKDLGKSTKSPSA